MGVISFVFLVIENKSTNNISNEQRFFCLFGFTALILATTTEWAQRKLFEGF